MIRRFSKLDLTQMMAIENSVHLVPWTEETFKMCFQPPHYLGWVLEQDSVSSSQSKEIIGFIIVAIQSNDYHILNLCIAREFQRRGYGTKLLQHAIDYATQHHLGMVYLEVRRSNSRAIALYQKMQFHLVGERKNYYPIISGQEDALIYAKALE